METRRRSWVRARRLPGVAGRIRDDDIAEVREKARIDDVVSQYVTLKRAGGGSLKGLCPFHDEKTPSFNVNPARQFFHCLAGETRVLTDQCGRTISERMSSGICWESWWTSAPRV